MSENVISLAQDTADDLSELNRMLDAAEAADAAGSAGTPDASANDAQRAGQSAAAEAGKQADNESTKIKSATPDASGAAKTDDKTVPADPPKQSAYAKEVERRDKSWKTLNAEKEAFAKAQAEFQAQRQQFEQSRKAAAKPAYTPEQYDAAAAKFEGEGKYDLAEAARAEAKRLRESPSEADQARAAQSQAQLEAAQKQSFAKARQEFPEVGQKGSPLHTALMEFLKEEPGVLDHPNGVYIASVFVKNRLEAARVPDLVKENDSLKSRVKELEALVTIPGGGPGKLPAPKSFEEMSLKEMEAELDAMASE